MTFNSVGPDHIILVVNKLQTYPWLGKAMVALFFLHIQLYCDACITMGLIVIKHR